MEDEIAAADFVLVICTAGYVAKTKQGPGATTGLGVMWEHHRIIVELGEAGGYNTKYVPVLAEGATHKDIPAALRGYTFFGWEDEEAYDRLYRHLTGQPEIIPPQVGTIRKLPPRML